MKKINSFVNQYPLSKTLKFSLIPIGKTEENFNNALLLENDKERAEKYSKVKEYIDRYHKFFINEVLSALRLDGISEYTELYFKPNKTDKEIKVMNSLEECLRKAIALSFSKDARYKALFKKDMIENILPSFLTSKNELEDVAYFYGFATYFTCFFENRKNMYSAKAQTTAISYRCINENLPRFLDNVKRFEMIDKALPNEIKNNLNDIAFSSFGVSLADIFNTDFFTFVLSQTYIDKYNGIIGGYIDENGNKVQGLNEYINLCNQQITASNNTIHLPLFAVLYKQILSDRDSISALPKKFADDNELLATVNDYFVNIFGKCLNETKKLFHDISSYNFNGIFVSESAVGEISNAVFGRWDATFEGWQKEYRELVPLKSNKSQEKYEENMHKALKKKLSFSLSEIQNYGEIFKTEDSTGNIAEYLQHTIIEKINTIKSNYTEAEYLLTSNYIQNNGKELKNDKNAVEHLKNLLDSAKDLEYVLKSLKGTGKEENKDFSFYGSFTQCCEAIEKVDPIYDKVRNFVTQKPYSLDKVRLNFNNSHLMSGWATGQEIANASQLFKCNENEYYIGIIEKKYNTQFKNGYKTPIDISDKISKICYEQIPNPGRNIPNLIYVDGEIKKINGRKDSNGVNQILEETKMKNLPKDINDIRLKNGYKVDIQNSSRKEITEFIEYYMNATLKYYSKYDFKFKNSSEYNSFSEFVEDVNNQAYQVNYQEISKKQLLEYVEKGYIYLFKIHCKDFSKYSHGKKNLHTMYFEMLFNEKNLADAVYKLNGGAEMFYREASIKAKDMVIHKANEPIQNKNIDNLKKNSTFKYDLIKYKRYTKRQFSLHLPITLNFKATGNKYLNDDVKIALKNADNNYIIGIDRGERNLLYICVIDGKGKIIEQKSLNEIVSDNDYKVDYHKLLASKEKERDNARKNWSTIENIKELKEGYLSQVIHQICGYVVKYDAIIAMEDLNFGFKKGRFKVEKQVYQKFENMLCEKLKYLVIKDEEAENPGGLLKAYQLTNGDDKYTKGKQNGIVFYVPAWLTSKIDPVTGFVDLLKPKYSSVKASLEFIEKIDDIKFNSNENMFEFDIDYSKFPRTSASYRKKWVICTNGERIVNERNKEKNNMWDNKTILLTKEFKNFNKMYNIDCSKNIKESILSITDSAFHKKFIKLFAYTLQLRNSITGDVNIDYLLSPVKDSNGNFFDSRKENKYLPQNADANGAYNIARKAMWAISVLKSTDMESLKNANLSIKNSDWLEYTQK